MCVSVCVCVCVLPCDSASSDPPGVAGLASLTGAVKSLATVALAS